MTFASWTDWKTLMTRLVPLLTLALMFTAQSAQASIEGPWCAHRSMGGGFIENNCGMMSYEQCRANIFGTPGAWCTQNPRYVPPAAPGRRKARPRR